MRPKRIRRDSHGRPRLTIEQLKYELNRLIRSPFSEQRTQAQADLRALVQRHLDIEFEKAKAALEAYTASDSYKTQQRLARRSRFKIVAQR